MNSDLLLSSHIVFYLQRMKVDIFSTYLFIVMFFIVKTKRTS